MQKRTVRVLIGKTRSVFNVAAPAPGLTRHQGRGGLRASSGRWIGPLSGSGR
jgi:hypothetical protein